jgi:hypothetical protein
LHPAGMHLQTDGQGWIGRNPLCQRVTITGNLDRRVFVSFRSHVRFVLTVGQKYTATVPATERTLMGVF